MLYTDYADFIHLRLSVLSAGVNYQKNPVMDVTEIKKCIGAASLTVVKESRQGLKLGRNVERYWVNGHHGESRQGLKLGRNIAAPMITHSVRNVP